MQSVENVLTEGSVLLAAIWGINHQKPWQLANVVSSCNANPQCI